MFEFQKNADGSFKAFTFTPCDTPLFPSGIRCYQNDEFQQFPIMLKKSYISKINVRESSFSNKEEGQTFIITMIDGSNDKYVFEFRKQNFCSQYTVKSPENMYNKQNGIPNEVFAKEHLEFVIQTIFNDKSLCITINKLSADKYDVLIERS